VEAKRNPRKTSRKIQRAREASDRLEAEYGVDAFGAAVARSTGSDIMDVVTWGSASLHPRLYAVARCASFSNIQVKLV
jgi:DNA-directed RNA polymerase specialized sigma subunit